MRVEAVKAASNLMGVQFPHGVEFTQRVVGVADDGVWGQASRRGARRGHGRDPAGARPARERDLGRRDGRRRTPALATCAAEPDQSGSSPPSNVEASPSNGRSVSGRGERQHVAGGHHVHGAEVVDLDDDPLGGDLDDADALAGAVRQVELVEVGEPVQAALLERLLGGEPVDRAGGLAPERVVGDEAVTVRADPPEALAVAGAAVLDPALGGHRAIVASRPWRADRQGRVATHSSSAGHCRAQSAETIS